MYIVLKNRHQNVVTTENKIESKRIFKQIPSNFQEILFKRIDTWRTMNEEIRKRKQNEMEEKMGISKIKVENDKFGRKEKIQHIHNCCLK